MTERRDEIDALRRAMHRPRDARPAVDEPTTESGRPLDGMADDDLVETTGVPVVHLHADLTTNDETRPTVDRV